MLTNRRLQSLEEWTLDRRCASQLARAKLRQREQAIFDLNREKYKRPYFRGWKAETKRRSEVRNEKKISAKFSHNTLKYDTLKYDSRMCSDIISSLLSTIH
jgi:hypothetical protein